MKENSTTIAGPAPAPSRRWQPAAGVSDLLPMVLSFDVEAHHRIEAAAGLEVAPAVRDDYRRRMVRATGWILDELAARGIRATFFIVGQIAEDDPRLVRSINEAGHEVASHGWDHRRIHRHGPRGFREDVRRSKDALEQAGGAAVVGYRAPTFSLVRKTAWAFDILADLGFLYDSSIYPGAPRPLWHPGCPSGPVPGAGARHEILEIPPATVRLAGVNVPIGGGGYFRLCRWPLMKAALWLSRRDPSAGATLLYFHPWEFDPDQPRLPLKRSAASGLTSASGTAAAAWRGCCRTPVPAGRRPGPAAPRAPRQPAAFPPGGPGPRAAQDS